MGILASCAAVDALIDYALGCGLMHEDDVVWARNGLLTLVGCEHYAGSYTDSYAQKTHDEASRAKSIDPDELLVVLAARARENGALNEGVGSEERFRYRAMNHIMPRPSEVRARFNQLLDEGLPEAACRYLYTLSCNAAYVHKRAAERDIKWSTDTDWGKLEITINRAKPEKDPRAIAALASKSSDDAPQSESNTPYPACQLCLENEGYQGRFPTSPQGAHPARQNLRIVRVAIGSKMWGLQFSPYSYYDEHCIVINPEHIPMHIDRTTFSRLFDFVDLFPHYFVGSNADLPIVGGSILNHDHFQAGRHTFPLDEAPLETTFTLDDFPSVNCGIVKWPLSTIRLSGEDREEVLNAATHVLNVWRGYSDESVGILAESHGAAHNTITPIARRTSAKRVGEKPIYTLNLVLRCNIASAEYPLGVFHPHAELHHIKKENIGLIEAMGLAILPGRLARELAAVQEALVGHATLEQLRIDDLTAKHADWALDVAVRHPELCAENARGIIQDEVGRVFELVLECAGVFKWDKDGRAAFVRFISSLN